MKSSAESQAVNSSFSQASCQECWVGGSINVDQNNMQVSGIKH